MTIPAFLSLVEIRTKVASVIPFLTGTFFALYHLGRLRLFPMLLFFFSMLAFDMFTTALNNRQDWRRARKREGYNYERHNAIVHYQLSPFTVDATLALLFLFASATGIGLVLFTDLNVLYMGMLAFAAGAAYSAGPLPISRTPLGEAASGLAMGLGIPFLAIYIHMPVDTLFTLMIQNGALTIALQIVPLIGVFLVSIPCICCIAGIMLANNLCDMGDDWDNHRFTLPIVAGKENGMRLLHILYIASLLAIPAAVVTGNAHWISLAVLAVTPKLAKNLAAFRKVQTKKDTFGLAVLNFLIICLPFASTLGIGALIN